MSLLTDLLFAVDRSTVIRQLISRVISFLSRVTILQARRAGIGWFASLAFLFVSATAMAATFTVDTATAPMTGLWWNQNESGWGISLTQQGPVIFAAWYTYDQSGAPLWYVMSNCTVAGNGCNGDIYRVVGGTPLTTSWSGSGKVVTKVGAGTFAFTDNNTGVLNYTVNGASGIKNITRQIFASGTTGPAVDYSALWWNANESGWGISLTQQYGIIFVTMFTYDAGGNPVWYVASYCPVSGSGCTGTLYKTSGGSAPTLPWVGPITATPVGTITFAFTDASNGTMSFMIDGLAGTRTISKEIFYTAKSPVLAEGVFALMDPGDTSALIDSYASRANVAGIALRTSWDLLEPSNGVYVWSTVDAAFDAVRARGKHLTVHVIGTQGMTPKWLTALGVATYTYSSPTGSVTDPLPWDTVFLTRYTQFMAALGAHIRSRGDGSLLAALSDTVPVPEMSLVGCKNGVLSGGTAFNRTSYLTAWETTVDALATAFPNVPLYISAPVNVICASDNDGKAFYTELMNHAFTKTSSATVFAADLNALGSSRMAQVDSFISRRAAIAFQTIWSATNDPQNRMRGTLKDAVCKGIGYGARYFEIYKADLANPDAAIQDAIQRAYAGHGC